MSELEEEIHVNEETENMIDDLIEKFIDLSKKGSE